MPFIYIAYMLFLGWAFFDGLARWWGTGSPVGAVVFIACATIVPGGGFFISAVAFYGAYAAWRWEWWQAGLFAFPGFALTASVLLVSGTYFLWQSLFGKTDDWQSVAPTSSIAPLHPASPPLLDRQEPNPIPIPKREEPIDWNAVPEQARIALRFREDAERAFARVRHLPEIYQQRFLAALDADPRMDVDLLIQTLEAEKMSEEAPFASEECNLIYRSLSDINSTSAQEFKEAADLLGDKFDHGRAFLLIARRYQLQYHSSLASLVEFYSGSNPAAPVPLDAVKQHQLIGIANTLLYSHVLYPEARNRLTDIRLRLYSQELTEADRQFIIDLANEKGVS